MSEFNIKIKSTFNGRGGTAGSFTWQRLEEILHSAKELRDDETIEGYSVSQDGVNFYIKKVDKS